MKFSRPVAFCGNIILFLMEYVAKFCAGVAAIIVLAAEGPFFHKLGTVFSSILDVLNRLIEWPANVTYMASVIQDYNTLTAAAFNQRYGGQAMNRVMESLNDGAEYYKAVYQNLAQQPVATILATVTAFATLYICARAFRFVRQKGEGSYLIKAERRLGDRIFKKPKSRKV